MERLDAYTVDCPEFRIFVEKAERQLRALFRAIDKDGDGKLAKDELQIAFKNAGLTVSKRRLGDFFNDMDLNNDGYVSFDEWRFVQFFFSLLANTCGVCGAGDCPPSGDAHD